MKDLLQIRRWRHFSDSGKLRDAAAEKILGAAESAIAARGKFTLVLAGGNTPRAIYEKLATIPARWQNWHIYLGDERCLPPEHPERNSRMVIDAWLGKIPIPAENIHLIPAEKGAEAGAKIYSGLLDNMAEFDLVLLGLGEDGHTASLFPGKNWTGAAAIPVFDAPKPPPERISLSANRLSLTREAIFLVSGAGKMEAVRRWRAEEAIPAAAVAPHGGVDIYLDF